ncbi:MAG: nitroreductase [Pseudomonadales bacterium]|nr:nitroreductase [Pseudomonadales bacterium]
MNAENKSFMDTAQIYTDIVNKRRSVRAFKPDPIDQATLDKIFLLAQRAPSNCNTQPWITHVVSGEKLEMLRTLLPGNMAQGNMSFDFPYNGVYQGSYKDRQHDAAQQLYGAVGLTREDKEKRQQVFMENYRFFGAPHAAFLFLPGEFGLREAADVGMYAQTLMLALTAHGLASCPQTALGFHANAIREVLDIDENNKLLFGLSFGFEDSAAAINTARVGRVALGETTFFHS